MLDFHTNHADKVERIKVKNDMLLQFKNIPGTGDYQNFLKKLKKNSKKNSQGKPRRPKYGSSRGKRRPKKRSKSRKNNFIKKNKKVFRRKPKIPPLSDKPKSTKRTTHRTKQSSGTSRFRGTIIEKFSNFFKAKHKENTLSSHRSRVPYKNEGRSKVNYSSTVEPIQISDKLHTTKLKRMHYKETPQDYLQPLEREIKEKIDAYYLLKQHEKDEKGIRKKKGKSQKQKMKEIAENLNIGELHGSSAEIMAKVTARIIRVYNKQFSDMIINDLLIESIAIMNDKENQLSKSEREQNIARTCDELFFEIAHFKKHQTDLLKPNYTKKKKMYEKFQSEKNYEENLKKIQEIENGVVDKKFHIQHEFDTDRIKNMLIRDKLMKKGRYDPSYYANRIVKVKLSRYQVAQIEKVQIMNEREIKNIPYLTKEYSKAIELFLDDILSQTLSEVALEMMMMTRNFVERKVQEEFLLLKPVKDFSE